MTLYKLTAEMADLLNQLEELPPEDPELYAVHEEAIRNTLECLEMDFADKADGYGKVLKQLAADAEMLKREKLRIASKQSELENNMNRLREAMLRAMVATDQRKIKTPLFTFSVSTRQKAVLASGVEPEDLPEEWQKRKPVEANMQVIEKWLKDGGVTVVAHLEEVNGLTVR